MQQSEIERRHHLLQTYFEGRDWDVVGEYDLKRQLVLNSSQLLPNYPFVIDDIQGAVLKLSTAVDVFSTFKLAFLQTLEFSMASLAVLRRCPFCSEMLLDIQSDHPCSD